MATLLQHTHAGGKCLILYQTIRTFNDLEKNTFENNVEKGENCSNQHFLLLPQFSLSLPKHFSFSVRFILSTANAFNFDKSIILSFGKEFTLTIQ